VVFWECLRVIKNKRPAVFVLENVKGLMMVRNGEFFQQILEGLSGARGYSLHYKILNTKHYGLPQSRERLYIVGIRKTCMKRAFEWPREVPLQQPLASFVDAQHRHQDHVWPSIEKKEVLAKIPADSVFVDLSFPQGSLPNLATLCPCLNTSANLWNVPYHRLATTTEYLTLQGFPANFKQVVSDRQLKKQVGNSMSVSVLYHLLKAILKCLD
jgi:DNA (cytosine-5)-methyltransferase 1